MKSFIALLWCLLLTTVAIAQIIHVPADYPTIQLGINAATPGDTVLVADGIYYEQINFLGKKPLMVASQFLIDGDTNHIANTIIDGSQISSNDSASVVNFISGEDTTSIICGFTIQHGRGTINEVVLPEKSSNQQSYLGSSIRSGSLCATKVNYTLLSGGGIFISGSGAKIMNNHITENNMNDAVAEEVQIVDGAGISTQVSETGNWVVIGQNVIDNNNIYVTKFEGFGAGMSICTNTRIYGNTISDNKCIASATAHVLAGGMGISQMPDWAPKVAMIEQNMIKNNLCSAANSYANSAGVFLQLNPGIFSGNEVSENVVYSGASIGGATALYLLNDAVGFQVNNNLFKGNTCNIWGGALGIETTGQTTNAARVENNYFIDNSAASGSAIIIFIEVSKLILIL